MASDSSSRPDKPKQRRISRACDYCHQRSIRCRVSDDGVNCQNCNAFAQRCTYHRKPRRRGVPRQNSQPSSTVVTADNAPGPVTLQSSQDLQQRQQEDHQQPSSWVAPVLASQANIVDLVELYFEIVYPVFPFFHQPSFMRRISRAEYTSRKALFATTMAVCALVSSRVRDGSITNPQWDVSSVQEVDPDAFYEAAQAQLAGNMTADLDILRAHSVMALAAIQCNRIRDMHYHLGMYHTLVAMDGLHDEGNWPRDIGTIEKEERRRLFWSVYTLDIYSSVVWGGIVRSREQQSNVAYPMEVDDEEIDNSRDLSAEADLQSSGISPSLNRHSGVIQSSSWLSGWNFITDIYRVLEHALARFRGHQHKVRGSSFLHEIFEGEGSGVTQASVRDKVLQMYINLPECFKETPPMTFNSKQDRFGFQAANITGSLQLLRIVLFTAGGASIEERCQIAREVVDAFASVPVAYLLAISTPQLHHLGGIGAILGSVFEERLSEMDYNNVRSIMLAMSELLESLEANQNHERAWSTSERLRSQIARIDDYMAQQRMGTSSAVEGMTGTLPPGAGGEDLQAMMTTNHDMHDEEAFGGTDPNGEDNGLRLFQVPPDLLEQLTWNFEFF